MRTAATVRAAASLQRMPTPLWRVAMTRLQADPTIPETMAPRWTLDWVLLERGISAGRGPLAGLSRYPPRPECYPMA
jgi:hypothetical protein